MDRDPTAGHQAICAECATSPAFYRAARTEAERGALLEEPAVEARK
jgi:hypothetical protein